jgi:DUF1009 family protein
VETGRVLLLERPRTLAIADDAGIAVMSVALPTDSGRTLA